MHDALKIARSRIGEHFVNSMGAEAEIVGISRRRVPASGNVIFIVKFLESGVLLESEYGNLRKGQFKDYSIPSVYGVGISYRGAKTTGPLYKTWAHMLERCYQPTSRAYHRYGGRGVRVCDAWLRLECFEREAVDLPRYELFASNPSAYSLDKDIRGDGTLYSKDTCMFATAKEQSLAQERVRPIKAIDKDGNEQIFRSKCEAAKALGVQNANLYKVLSGERPHTCGYRFVSL